MVASFLWMNRDLLSLVRLALFPHGPGHPIWLAACVNLSHYLHRLQIDHCNIVIGRASHEGPQAIWLHYDSGRTGSNLQSLHDLA
jgi:hypothetical protein